MVLRQQINNSFFTCLKAHKHRACFMRSRGQRFVSNSTDLKPATHKIKPFAMVCHIFISQKMVNWRSMMASPLIIPRNYAVFIATIWSNLPLPKTNFTVQWSNAIENIILEHKHTVLLQPTFLMKLQNRNQLSTTLLYIYNIEHIFEQYDDNPVHLPKFLSKHPSIHPFQQHA